ncbi:MAG TPA: hypothetical protein VMD27_11460 [Candidatus Aquilonibacter sp.]|nr:hypothetical protein [Candidatus Aquilonibacter sp.]
MKLIGYNEERKNFHLVRNLTDAEVTNYEKYTPIVAEARNRFKLFRILGSNFNEWTGYISSLLNSQVRNDENDWLQLDRLLLNYLTCAYTIQEHFKASFQRRFRKDAVKLKEYSDFLDKLYHSAWAFAFYIDFRGYIQHCELGIGNYQRQISSTSVKINITHDSAQLLADSKEWKRCKLTDKNGTLDLVKLLEEFHHHMLKSYGGYVAKSFFPELFPAAKFYANLTSEVLKIGPGFRMVFGEGEPQKTFEEGKQQMQLQLKLVPNDLLAELGFSISPQN